MSIVQPARKKSSSIKSIDSFSALLLLDAVFRMPPSGLYNFAITELASSHNIPNP